MDLLLFLCNLNCLIYITGIWLREVLYQFHHMFFLRGVRELFVNNQMNIEAEEGFLILIIVTFIAKPQHQKERQRERERKKEREKDE